MKKTTLSIVPINSVIFPHQTIKLFIPSNSTFYKKNLIGSMLGVCFQKNPTKRYSLFSYLSEIGIVIRVTDETTETNSVTKKSHKMIRGAALSRYRIKQYISKLHPYSAEVELFPDDPALEQEDISFTDPIVAKLKDLAYKYIEFISNSNMVLKTRFESVRSESSLVKLHYIIASYLRINDEDKCKLLEVNTVKERVEKIVSILEEELYKAGSQIISDRIDVGLEKSTQGSFPSEGRSHGLKNSDDLDTVQNKLQAAGLPEGAQEVAMREFNRLKQMESRDAEYNVQRRYVEVLADLPWSQSTEETKDIDHAEKILNRDHAGLENVKRRILEFIAVRILKKNSRGTILCLQGPPGIGKTSLGKSIAEALGKKFARVALGGVRDEAEIRGHRRTYVGAMPGVFIDALLKSKSNNPVILLDEIDKVGNNTAQGDPSAALLEVLDPNQNNTFQDHYLGVPFDFSNILFVATANTLDTIHPALLDRMEVISLAGYTQYEKAEIAKNYLIPKQIKENGIDPSFVEFPEDSIHYIIAHYTGEAGVRNLERTISSIFRKIAFKFLKSQQNPEFEKFFKVEVTEVFIQETLGPKVYDDDIKKRIDQPGIAIGLAWTQNGGRTLLVEASKTHGKGEIQITGQLGDVMKESVTTALGWIKSHKELLHLVSMTFNMGRKSNKEHFVQEKFDLKEYDIHIHFPAAAIPKDGPSAGITIVTALVRDDVAMTGEISLKGSVLAVGGIKEKCLAAYTQGIRNIIIPEQNKRNIEELPKEIRKNIKFHFLSNIHQVLLVAFDLHIKEADIKSALATGSKKINKLTKL